MSVVVFCPDEPQEDHGDDGGCREDGHGQGGQELSVHPREKEHERERREPCEVD